MNKLLNGLKTRGNITTTTNGATTYKSTMNKVYDLFATGAAMRGATDSDCINFFKDAYEEDATLALKCLFYLRAVRCGQGERRFFRVCLNWLAKNYPREAKNLIKYTAEFGRWDDLFVLFDTPVEKDMVTFVSRQLLLDIDSTTPSLLGKWMPSMNTSSAKTVQTGTRFCRALHLSAREYRKMLSLLRKRIKIVETLMSQNRWSDIEFDKLPSRAGFIYRNAFARHDVTKERYEKFIKDKNTTVNAGTLYPYDVVKKAVEFQKSSMMHDRYGLPAQDEVERLAINKYWDNLTDYFNGATLNALVVCDTSGSMRSSWSGNINPIDVAISLSLYTAERANGPFKNHFISFSSRPKLIEVKGYDFVDKVWRIYKQNLCENTNIEATFDLILHTALAENLKQEDLPESLIIISDMQFDAGRERNYRNPTSNATLMENIESKWNAMGYTMPKLVYWNVNAALSEGNIPMKNKDGITFVSGASPVIFKQILTGKTAMDLMYEVLMSEKFKDIVSVM